MIKFIKIGILLCFTITLFANEIKLGNPVTIDFLNKYYGEEVTATQEGDYSNIYANYEERYILYDLNLYRLAPQILKNEDVNTAPDVKKCIDWGYCFQPVKPLYWNIDLSRAARFHDDDMIKNNCFAHNDCDGGDIWARIQRYYTSSAMGENIAAGSKYDEVTKNFVNEKSAPLGTTGHRESVFSASFNEVGLGYLLGGSYRMYTTQDFGASATPTFIPAGIHSPKSPNKGSNVKFMAIYHDKNQNPDENPKFYLVLNGKKIEMQKKHSSLDWNSDNYVGAGSVVTKNWYSAAYEINADIEKGCNNYNFLAVTNGEEHYYPDEGSLLVGSACNNKIYDKNRIVINNTGSTGGGNGAPSEEGCSFSNTNNNQWLFIFMIFIIIYQKERYRKKIK